MTDHDHDIQQLIGAAGSRVAPAADRAARVRAAAEAAWRAEVTSRRVRRWYWATGLTAAAAALVLAVLPQFSGARLSPPQPLAADAGTVIAATGRVTLRTAAAQPGTVSIGQVAPVGAMIATEADAFAAVRLAFGGELRVSPNTIATLTDRHSIRLERGTIYLDSQGATPGSFTVVTAAGTVRDIGTRFEVQVEGLTHTRVRVRDGAIQLEHAGAIDRAPAGTELSLIEGRVASRPIAAFSTEWRWITKAAPAFRVEGASLEAFLDWAARESGLTIDTSAVPPSLKAAVLHGSIAGMSVEDALANVLPTCGLTSRVAAGRIVVRRAD